MTIRQQLLRLQSTRLQSFRPLLVTWSTRHLIVILVKSSTVTPRLLKSQNGPL